MSCGGCDDKKPATTDDGCSGGGGFFSGWFGSGSSSAQEDSSNSRCVNCGLEDCNCNCRLRDHLKECYGLGQLPPLITKDTCPVQKPKQAEPEPEQESCEIVCETPQQQPEPEPCETKEVDPCEVETKKDDCPIINWPKEPTESEDDCEDENECPMPETNVEGCIPGWVCPPTDSGVKSYSAPAGYKVYPISHKARNIRESSCGGESGQGSCSMTRSSTCDDASLFVKVAAFFTDKVAELDKICQNIVDEAAARVREEECDCDCLECSEADAFESSSQMNVKCQPSTQADVTESDDCAQLNGTVSKMEKSDIFECLQVKCESSQNDSEWIETPKSSCPAYKQRERCGGVPPPRQAPIAAAAEVCEGPKTETGAQPICGPSNPGQGAPAPEVCICCGAEKNNLPVPPAVPTPNACSPQPNICPPNLQQCAPQPQQYAPQPQQCAPQPQQCASQPQQCVPQPQQCAPQPQQCAPEPKRYVLDACSAPEPEPEKCISIPPPRKEILEEICRCQTCREERGCYETAPQPCARCGTDVRGENKDCPLCRFVTRHSMCPPKIPEFTCEDDDELCDCDDCVRDRCNCGIFKTNAQGKPIYEGGMCLTRAGHYLWKTTAGEPSFADLALEGQKFKGLFGVPDDEEEEEEMVDCTCIPHKK